MRAKGFVCTILWIVNLFLWGNMAAQENVIDLGTDTLFGDLEYEYVAAFEMDRYMESFVFFRTAMDAYMRQDLLVAKAAVSKAIKLNGRETKFKLLKAWILSKESSYKKAIRYTGDILEGDPENKEAMYCMAINQHLLHDHSGADATFSRLISLDSGQARAYYGRAEAKTAMKDYKGAIGDYSLALEREPGMALAYEGRGMAFFRIYEFRSAVRDFNQYLVAVPSSGRAYFYRGMAHLRLNEFSDACKNFENAVRLKYKDASAEYERNCNY